MSDENSSLLAERLRSLLSYDLDTGVFTWKSVTSNRVQAGQIASSTQQDGYARVGIDGKRYLSHRLAWLYVNGCWPAGFIDHINGIRTDNRFENLREVSRSGNSRNMRRAMAGAASNHLGVSKHKRGWSAKIRYGGKQVHLGTFKTPELAHEAYLQAKRIHHETCTL